MTLIQAGNLEVGSSNGGTNPFPGKIAQVAIYSAKVPQATILASIDRGLTGSETSLISAYSGANTTDLASTGNNLTAQNGAVSGYADAPFGNGGISSTLEYGLTMSVSSDGLTEVVQCPEGCALPTTGGITASAYSSMANPYGWPKKPIGKLETITQTAFTTTATPTVTDVSGHTISYTATGTETIRLKLNPYYLAATGGATTFIQLYVRDGTTAIATKGFSLPGANFAEAPAIEIDYNPTAGAHTFVASVSQNAAGTLTFAAATTSPSIFSLEVL